MLDRPSAGERAVLVQLDFGQRDIPERLEEVRLLTEDIMDRIGVDAFFAELAAKDPETASRLDPKNRQRLVRA